MVDGLGAEILDLTLRYLAVPCETGTARETAADAFFRDCLGAEPYFTVHPDHLGRAAIPGDALGRAVNWALVKGSGPDTVVLIHHSDTVGTEDYGALADRARDPGALAEGLRGADLDPQARRDLESGEFLFGHGAADMRSGGAIQMVLLRRFSRAPRRGNLLLLALPDEENLSAGMRHAPALLDQLRLRFGLDWHLMVNAEPHQRRDPGVGLFSEGSVGKTLPFVHARGVLAHAGQVFGGLNPVNLVSEVARRLELNTDLCDARDGEVTPPPTCLFLKDSKDRYDVSLPRSAFACFNVMTLGRTPEEILGYLERQCREAAERVLGDMAAQHGRYLRLRGAPAASLPWSVRVIRFEQLEGAPDARMAEDLRSGRRGMIQATWDLVEAALDRAGIPGPALVLGFVPPFYPCVTNAAFGDAGHRAMGLTDHLIRHAAARGQAYAREPFYTGICDLSYSSIQGGLERGLVPNMPLHGPAYEIPFALIRANGMPCINIGPWGKDFHRLTERVRREDVVDITPGLMREAIEFMLGESFE